MTAMRNPVVQWDEERWRDRAACRHTDPDLFFPPGSGGDVLPQINAAKAVCRSCPAQAPCLQFALATNQEAGIWGGKDEDERRRLRRLRRSRPRLSVTLSTE